MTVFTVTLVQGQYEDRRERTLIFSSLEKVLEWKDSYKTSYDSFCQNGKEYAIIKEVWVDYNEILAISEGFYLPIADPNTKEEQI